jgi:hypothetical protein
MKTKILVTALVGFLVVSVVAIGMLVPASAEAKGKPEAPAAKAKAPDLVKIEFIHWKRGFAKPPCDGDGVCEPGEKPSCSDCKNGGNGEEPPVACYAFMGQYGKRYLKWAGDPAEITCTINTSNPYGLGSTFVIDAISASAAEWDWYTATSLFYDCTTTTGPEAAYNVGNRVNGISFDNYYGDPGIIAACMVWYSPATKQIVEFDIVFETDFTWGDATGDPSVMDLQNIATHEIGHALGLADVYELECSDVTMYGYSGNGDIEKRDIADQDKTGIQTLYGAP